MMILTAIVLLVAFVALAAMVARVNQVAQQTTVESRRAILDEAGPLQHALDDGIVSLNGGRTITTGLTTNAVATVESTVAAFYPQDVGRHITGTNIPAAATVIAYSSPTRITISAVATGTATSAAPVTLRLGFITTGATDGTTTLSSSAAAFVAADVGKFVSGTNIRPGTRIVTFTDSTNVVMSDAATGTASGLTITIGKAALSATSTPTIDAAMADYMAQLQKVQANHGLWLDWTIDCATSGDVTTGRLVAHLSDGEVWVELTSALRFTRASCTAMSG